MIFPIEEQTMKEVSMDYLNNKACVNKDALFLEPLKKHIDDGCKTIGIIGDYGSGKSSIINGLVENLEENQDYVRLSLANFINEKDSNDDEIKKYDVRKNMTLQLLEKFSPKKNKEYVKIKNKLTYHNQKNDNMKKKIISIGMTIMVLLVVQNRTDELSVDIPVISKEKLEIILEIKNFFLIVSLILIPISIFLIIRMILEIDLKELSVNKIKLKKEDSKNYLDYDLETIVTLLNLFSKIKNNEKKLLLIIEDIDRYNSQEVLQEMNDLSKIISSNICVIIPIKKDIFDDPITLTKFFEAEIDILPITNKDTMYEEVMKIINEKESEENELTTDIIIKTISLIPDLRMFNKIYNKYIFLKKNSEKIYSSIKDSKKERNEIYIISFFQIMYPKYKLEYINNFFDEKSILEILINKNKEKKNEIQKKINESEIELKEIIEINLKNKGRKIKEYEAWMRLEIYIKNPNYANFLKTPNIGEYLEKNHTNIWNIYKDEHEKILNKDEMQENEKIKEEEISKYKEQVQKIEEIEKNIKLYVESTDVEKIIKEHDIVKKEIQKIIKNSVLDSIIEINILEIQNLILFAIETGYLTKNWSKYTAYYSGESDDNALKQRQYISTYPENIEEYESIQDISDPRLNFFTENFVGKLSIDMFESTNIKMLYILVKNINDTDNKEKLIKMLKKFDRQSRQCENYEEFKERYEYDYYLCRDKNKINNIFKNLYQEIENTIIVNEKRTYSKNEEIISKIKCKYIDKMNFDMINLLFKIYPMNRKYSNKIIIELLYSYYNFENEKYLNSEMFYLLELNINNDEIEKSYRNDFIQMFKESRNENKILKTKISDLEKFSKAVYDIQKYIKPMKIFKKDFIEYNETNVIYMYKNAYSNIKTDIKFWEYLANNYIEEMKSKILNVVANINGNYYTNLNNEQKGKLVVKILKLYDVKVKEIKEYENIKEELIRNKVFEKNEKNYMLLLESNEYKSIISSYDSYNDKDYIDEYFYEKCIELLKSNELDELTAKIFIQKMNYKFNDIQNLDDEIIIEIIKNNKLIEEFKFIKEINKKFNSEELIVLYINNFSKLNCEKIEEFEINEFNEIIKIILDNEKITNDKKIKVLTENKKFIEIELNENWDIEINAVLSIYLNIIVEKYNEYTEKINEEQKSKIREIILKKSKKKFLDFYYPNYNEYSENNLWEEINKNMEIKEKIDIIANMNEIKNNVKKVLIDLEIYDNFKFKETGAGSKTKIVDEVFLKDRDLIKILKEDKIIKNVKENKIIK